MGRQATLKSVNAIYTQVNFQELYEGCALIGEIDDFLDSHDFQRVAVKTPFHPFYGDAFYLKKDVLAKSQTTIITSIAPKDFENQKLAIDSWRVHGFRVISLNSAEEVTILQSLYPHVTFHTVSRHAQGEVGKPLIYLDEIINFLKNHPENLLGNVFGIINADIHLRLDFDYQTLIETQAKQSLVISSRVEVNSPDETTGKIYTTGFDAFFFDEHLLDKLPKSDFCLGMPWWDYWFPLVAMQQHISVKYLVKPIAYHVQHPINYAYELYKKYGIKFTQLFQPDLAPSLAQMLYNKSPDLNRSLIGIVNSFLLSFYDYAQHLHPISHSLNLPSPPGIAPIDHSINHGATELHRQIGDMYRQQGKLTEAIASYQKVLTNDANDALSYLGLVKIYLSQGILELATESISHIQALQPEVLTPEIYIQFGKLLLQRGKVPEAIEQLQSGLSLIVQTNRHLRKLSQLFYKRL